MAKTALVVDDAFSLRQLVAFTMRDAGFEVDLIITDLNMPVMDGITFIRKLRELPATRYTPVLMLTTDSQASLKHEAKAAGATGWIVKPFQPAKWLDVIAKVLP
jgi:two-component system chemotaxis response regulator CheY